MRQRWHKCDCGVVSQRDLLSAYFAMHVVKDKSAKDRLDTNQAEMHWSGVDTLLAQAVSNLGEVANRKSERLSSFGLNARERAACL